MSRYIHIISTDEVLLQQEACDQIISTAKKNGVAEREIVDVIDKFSWDELLANSQSLSLFSDIKLTDIRFSKAPKKDAQQALVELLAHAGPESLFLVRLPKMEKRQKNAKWFKSITASAQLEELWPPKPFAFQDWIAKRAQKLGLSVENDAIAMLAEQTEGNLLAASQSLDKLKLLYDQQSVDIKMLKAVVSDNARYSIFLCLDEALAGHGERAVRMLKKFESEAVAPISFLVNLTREINLCTQVAVAVSQGKPPMHALSSSFLWDSKKKMIVGAANRLPVAIWQRLLTRCGFLDRMVKGQEKGLIWQELESCLWLVSGKKIWGAKR